MIWIATGKNGEVRGGKKLSRCVLTLISVGISSRRPTPHGLEAAAPLLPRTKRRRSGDCGSGAARSKPRCQGRRPRTVAMSQAPQDYTRSPRRRVITQIVLSGRGRLVSRSGKTNGKSTTWNPSTLRRVVLSHPTRRQRPARTSSPRRARTARWKEATCQVNKCT